MINEQASKMEDMEQELKSKTIAANMDAEDTGNETLKQYLDELIQQVEYNINLLKH